MLIFTQSFHTFEKYFLAWRSGLISCHVPSGIYSSIEIVYKRIEGSMKVTTTNGLECGLKFIDNKSKKCCFLVNDPSSGSRTNLIGRWVSIALRAKLNWNRSLIIWEMKQMSRSIDLIPSLMFYTISSNLIWLLIKTFSELQISVCNCVSIQYHIHHKINNHQILLELHLKQAFISSNNDNFITL